MARVLRQPALFGWPKDGRHGTRARTPRPTPVADSCERVAPWPWRMRERTPRGSARLTMCIAP